MAPPEEGADFVRRFRRYGRDDRTSARHAAQTELMTRVFTGAIGVVLALAVSGCGGSGSPTVSETSGSPSPSPTVTALPQHGGLVGIIDSARKEAVCANVQLYTTTVEGGLTSSAREAFAAIIQSLRQGPQQDGLLTLVRRWQGWRHNLGDAKTAQRLTAFCAR